MKITFARFLLIALFALTLNGQAFSPKLLRDGQPDASDLQKFTGKIFDHADANTPREKAEAIWRYFLTDGRFAEPGIFYHIAGWAYEEPNGEVLDPVKLLNSYGFGLCYHIAPLLESIFKAGGFEDARCWFLTGHTVSEVYYDGGYHYFDSDMMGYNVAGDGPFNGKRVASVRDLERDPSIILGKLQAPDRTKPQTVDAPWYPADVQARAMGDVSDLFTTSKDNFLYPHTRFSSGHTMDFELRPGEKLTRFFAPEEPGLFYLPFKWDGRQWTEFPQDVAEFHIRTEDGPRSQKDTRMWATGRIDYAPTIPDSQNVTVIPMPSPYVIIDARFTMRVNLGSQNSSLRFETSIDGGTEWKPAGELKGPHQGEWAAEPMVVAKGRHGRLTAVSGSYGYLIRITRSGSAGVGDLRLTTRIQLNPRTLPVVATGDNGFTYAATSPVNRMEVPAPLAHAPLRGLTLVSETGQQLLVPSPGKTGDAIYTLEAGGSAFTGFDVGARFLDLRGGIAPNKLTAETRHTDVITSDGQGSIAWSLTAEGPFQPLWETPAKLQWRDGDPIDRVLLWPEVFRQVRNLPANTRRIYVKLSSSGPALDSVRLAVYVPQPHPTGSLEITQVWQENGIRHEHREKISETETERHFAFRAGTGVQNTAVIFSSAAP